MSNKTTFPIIQWRRHPSNDLPIPQYQTEGAAGFDLQACLYGIGDVIVDKFTILPQEKCIIHTGFDVAVPDGYELQIRPRSGLALREEIIILNSPGTIDADYRGEIMVGLKNLSLNVFIIKHGMRIAQAVLTPVSRASFLEVSVLNETKRGTGGFGSTGR